MASQTIDATQFTGTYNLGNGTASIKVSAVIGNGQIGASAVWLDDAVVATGVINHADIGTPAVIRGKTLKFRTIASNVNVATPRMIVTYFLTNGEENDDFALRTQVTGDGDSVVFEASFQLV